VVILQNGSTISRTNTSTKLEDYINPTSWDKWLFNSTNSKGIIPSLILWGPPGTGKTTLAQIIAQESNAYFKRYYSGVKDIREVIEKRNKVEVFSPPRINFIYR
jgi:replication-associated recombination protein RarA